MLSMRAGRPAVRALTRPGLGRAVLVLLSPCQTPAAARFCASHATKPSPSPPLLDQAAPDHRSLGVRQELFTSSIYSPGSPIFLPNGTRIFNRLVEFLRKQYVHYGFQEVLTPTIYKKALWEKSGHLENYSEDMFTVTSTSPARSSDTAKGHESDEYGLKPMNCPGHCLIFASQRRSYRDLPIRYADFSPLHRNEISGALSGLTRVRRFHQDDGHIFCRPTQIEEEIRQTLSFVKTTYDVLRLGPYRLVLSTRPQDHYIGALSEWDQAEAALKAALDSLGEPWTVNPGDGAFYGPKIDVILRDSDGKEHQTATIQLDFQLPKRFELEYQAPSPQDGGESETMVSERPVMIHRAVLGSVERLMALLIEHYNGKWPFWLNPRQIMIVTVNDTAPVVDKAHLVRHSLLREDEGDSASASSSAAAQLAIDIDDSARTLSLKIREAKSKGYGAIITIGANEVESSTLPVDVSAMPDVTLPDGTSTRSHKRPVKLDTTALRHFLTRTIKAYQ